MLNKITPCDVVIFVSLLLPLIALETKAYRRSYSTFLLSLATPIIVYLNKGHELNYGNVLLLVVNFVLLIRAILQKEEDRLLKR